MVLASKEAGMCQIVIFGDRELWNLDALLRAGVIDEEHVPSDAELARINVDVRNVCFCSVDVEAVLNYAGVPFWIDDAGNARVEAGPDDPTPPVAVVVGDNMISVIEWSWFDAWEQLLEWWRRRRWRPRPALL